ncbi:hypothetical protein M407DRAFT_221853 [Tulasnella calospora MUT 4182]|uniref:RING-type domain-containing protein n=1 Tax=Tulasnella calospora MUT 4182 TaxID=1051891 RepID=A0A0C3Q7D6_9AGAM|nr:hypothetical protein M407DRAFT_221853 [Tulasnella calospora MUT 4182]
MAMKLQQEFVEEDLILHARFSQLLATSQQTFECGICMETHPEDMVATVSGCSHDFCRECLTAHVRTALEGMKFPVICPICSTKQTKAGAYKGGVLTQGNVQMLGVSEEDYERWIEFELASHSVLIDCQKCKASMHVDRRDLQETPIITCPVCTCRSMWCRECQQSVESLSTEDHSCDGTKELDKLATQQRWQRCPGCQTLVERTMGCSTMTVRIGRLRRKSMWYLLIPVLESP